MNLKYIEEIESRVKKLEPGWVDSVAVWNYEEDYVDVGLSKSDEADFIKNSACDIRNLISEVRKLRSDICYLNSKIEWESMGG